MLIALKILGALAGLGAIAAVVVLIWFTDYSK